MSLAEAAGGIGVGFNVKAFGATGDGATDDTAAIQSALSAVGSSGGSVLLPDGTYMVSATLYIKANTRFYGSGKIKAFAAASWTGPYYRGLSNVNWNAGSITDENITVEGISFDWSNLGGQSGTAHVIYIKRARHVVLKGITVRNGASCVALLGCDNTLEDGNSYFDATNCLSDHWDNPSNASVVGCYMKAGVVSSISQMVNFNPEPTGLSGTGHVASGFTMTGCTLYSLESSSTQSQIEPLATGNYVERVTISNNTWVNAYIVARGDVRGLVVSGNEFSGFLGTAPAIYCKSQFGNYPQGVEISLNVVRDALTTAPAEGVIVGQSASAIMIGNAILGSGYSVSALTSAGQGGQIFATWVSGTPIAGRVQGGARAVNGADSYWGWTDTGGTSPRMYMQSDDNWRWMSTDGGGADRSVASLQALSSSSELRWSVPHLFQSYTRSTPAAVTATGTTIGTATSLTADINTVTASAGNTGVALQPVDGQRQTVVNTSGTTVNVYPNNNGAAQIDEGGIGVAVTVLAGKSKTFTRLSANDFRTIATT